VRRRGSDREKGPMIRLDTSPRTPVKKIGEGKFGMKENQTPSYPSVSKVH